MPMEKTNQIKVCRHVRPDDMRVGDYVAVLCETYEWPAIFGGCEPHGPTSLRATMIPNHTEDPVRVEAVCLPFVFVADAAGKRRVLDVRRVRLARVAKRFGRAVFEARSPKVRGKAGRKCRKCGKG